MKVHELKCWPEPFEAARKGVKRYEVRVDDGRGFAVGDFLKLLEWDPLYEGPPQYVDHDPKYTGRMLEVFVTHLSRGPEWGLPSGMVVMSIEELPF